MTAQPKDADDEDVPVPAGDADDGQDDGFVDPEGDEDGDRLELVRTGIIRIRVGGTRIRLRRPFFGEFKRLRLAVEDMNDEIDQLTAEAQGISGEIVREASNRPDGETPVQFAEWRIASRRRSREASRRLTDAAEKLRLDWFGEVVRTLTMEPDGGSVLDEERLPAWVTSPDLPNTMLSHWRMVPSGRG